MNAGSTNEMLSRMKVGQSHYIETTVEWMATDMRRLNPPKSRRSLTMKSMVFKTNAYTAVCAARAGEVKILVRVERVA